MPSERLIPLAAIEQLIRNAGADRVSDDAKIALKKILEQHGLNIAKKAHLLCKHAGRVTIKAEDIELASKH